MGRGIWGSPRMLPSLLGLSQNTSQAPHKGPRNLPPHPRADCSLPENSAALQPPRSARRAENSRRSPPRAWQLRRTASQHPQPRGGEVEAAGRCTGAPGCKGKSGPSAAILEASGGSARGRRRVVGRGRSAGPTRGASGCIPPEGGRFRDGPRGGRTQPFAPARPGAGNTYCSGRIPGPAPSPRQPADPRSMRNAAAVSSDRAAAPRSSPRQPHPARGASGTVPACRAARVPRGRPHGGRGGGGDKGEAARRGCGRGCGDGAQRQRGRALGAASRPCREGNRRAAPWTGLASPSLPPSPGRAAPRPPATQRAGPPPSLRLPRARVCASPPPCLRGLFASSDGRAPRRLPPLHLLGAVAAGLAPPVRPSFVARGPGALHGLRGLCAAWASRGPRMRVAPGLCRPRARKQRGRSWGRSCLSPRDGSSRGRAAEAGMLAGEKGHPGRRSWPGKECRMPKALCPPLDPGLGAEDSAKRARGEAGLVGGCRNGGPSPCCLLAFRQVGALLARPRF